jgi:hypothetical protein
MGYGEGLHGAHLRADLVAARGRHRVETGIARGELRRLWPGVLVEPGRLDDLRTRAAAAMISHGERAVLAGPTAAMLHDCTAIDTAETHVMVPYGHASRSRGDLVVHNGPLPSDDVTEVDGLRLLVLDRAVADLLCTARPRDGIALADQALARVEEVEREAFRATVARRLATRPDNRGTRRGAQLLELASGRAESPPESWLLLEVVDLGFPAPEANWPLYSPRGELLYRLDLAWPQARIALEYDGYAVHRGTEDHDARRIADLERRGWIVIVVVAEDLGDSTRLGSALGQAFRRRGFCLLSA